NATRRLVHMASHPNESRAFVPNAPRAFRYCRSSVWFCREWAMGDRLAALGRPSVATDRGVAGRSEERRVGKEWRSGGAPEQAEDGIRDFHVTGVQTCALPISTRRGDWFIWRLTLTNLVPSCLTHRARSGIADRPYGSAASGQWAIDSPRWADLAWRRTGALR